MLEKEFMHAVGFFEGLPINEERSFIDEKR